MARISFFELWLAVNPISEEFRRSLALKATALAEAYSNRPKDFVGDAIIDNVLADKGVNECVHNRES